MAITASLLRVLHRGGKTVEDMINVATAMSRGPDAGIIFDLERKLLELDCNDTVKALAICGLADGINAGNRNPTYARDEHTGKRDSNRARRGISDAEWRELRACVLERDEYVCQYCGAEDDLTCDHILPLVRGGTNDLTNLTTACRPCNSSKGDRLLDEWRGRVQ